MLTRGTAHGGALFPRGEAGGPHLIDLVHEQSAERPYQVAVQGLHALEWRRREGEEEGGGLPLSPVRRLETVAHECGHDRRRLARVLHVRDQRLRGARREEKGTPRARKRERERECER